MSNIIKILSSDSGIQNFTAIYQKMKIAMTPKFTRHDCTDHNGNLLFYIEIGEYYFLELILWTSIPLSVLNTEEINNYMRIIEERIVPNELREIFIEKLFRAIKQIPDIENCYMPAKLS